MSNSTTTEAHGASDAVLRDCARTLERVAGYRLPVNVDRRLLWLSENKETLTEAQREELNALVEFTEERTIDKLQAQAVLRRFTEHWPHLVSPLP